MRYSVWLFAAAWGSLVAAAWLLPQLWLVRLLVAAGSLLLTGVIAHLLAELAAALCPRPLLPDLRGKAVLVTGCSSGIGLSLAKRLDALGVAVFAGLRNPRCPGAAELRQTCSSNLRVLQLDVTRPDHVQHAVEFVRDNIGHREFWAVVNNAGITNGALLELTPAETFHEVWNTNALGGVRVTQAFMPLLRRSKGRVVFVNSALGVMPSPGVLPYTMSKFALRGFGDALRREVRRWGVSVHSVFPFFYKTSLTDYDTALKMLDNLWERSSQEIKDAYDERFMAGIKKAMKIWLFDRPKSSLAEPVDDIIDATVGATPNLYYVTGWMGKLHYALETRLPRSVADVIASYVTGFS
ncbi:retinol dehydrogenase 16-like [Bacillus rossius redtenbacheri]|uniref:retinol dehydrogenase 16-like n=1 Tax=Bacillus rossius redtenbacheri TaxID=93214 RepID=UPI002FDD7DF4